MKKENLVKLKIKIPKNKKLIQKLEPIFEDIGKIQSEMKEAETEYKQLIKELSEEAIPNNTQEIKINNNTTEDKNIIDSKVNKSKVNKSKKSKKTIEL
jgi:hypothetical protein